MAAAVLAETARSDIFFGPYFVGRRWSRSLRSFFVDYVIFDLQRSQEISISRNNLLAANFQFNDTHRRSHFPGDGRLLPAAR